MSDNATIPSLEDLLIFQDEGELPATSDEVAIEPVTDDNSTPTDTTTVSTDNTDSDAVMGEGEDTDDDSSNDDDLSESPDIHSTDDAIDTDSTEGGSEEDSETEVEQTAESPNGQLSNYYNFLVETGFLTVPDEFKFDGTEESLQEALETSDKLRLNGMKELLVSSVPEQGKNLLNYFLSGGTSIDTFINTYGNVDLEQVDLGSTSDQRRIVEEYYRQTTKYTPEKIDRIVNKLQDLDSLKEDAQEALDELKAIRENRQEELIQAAQQQELDRQQSIQRDRETLLDAIQESEFVQGTRKNKVKAFLFNEVTKSGQTSTDYNRVLSSITQNPQHIVQLANILMDYDPNKGFNMSRFEKQGKTKANSSFKKALESNINPQAKASGKRRSARKEISLEELLDKLQ